MNTLTAWLHLLHTPGIGAKTFRHLIQQFGSAENILATRRTELNDCRINQQSIDAILHPDPELIQADLNWLEQAENHHIITLLDRHYPPRLQQLADAPAILFVRGDPDYLIQPQLAMVGSRTPTASGLQTARDFARHLSHAGITITSGLASGIDGASHEGALEGIGGTIALVAHGLDLVYPAKHQQLAHNISRAGALVAEVPIGTEPARGLFPRRNRIISGLSIGTLVVEAARKSGSLITANQALEQNKEVFAIPGSIHNPMARGCHQLIRQGAKLVETASDILEELSPHLQITSSQVHQNTDSDKKNPTDFTQTLDPDHQKLLKCLAYEPTSIDELVNLSHYNAAEIASMLLIMELEGLIISQDGLYSRAASNNDSAGHY